MTEIIFDKNEDWENRILCSDESCIGTISTDGKCKECGKIYEGERPLGRGADHGPKEVVEEQTPVHSIEDVKDDDWDKRVLCTDESCIGIIGSDGKCKECGKPL